MQNVSRHNMNRTLHIYRLPTQSKYAASCDGQVTRTRLVIMQTIESLVAVLCHTTLQ